MRRPEPDADDSSSSVPATSASIAASTSGTSGTRKWRLRPKSFVRNRSVARRRPRAELVVVGLELARDEPRLGFRDVGVVRVVEQDDAPGVLADAVPGPGAAEVARGRLRRVAEVRVVRADQDERLDALALAEPHGRRAPLLWPTTTVSSSTPSPRRKGTHLRARATSSRLEPRDAAVRLMFARDDRVGHHLWQDDLVEEAGVVQSALEPAVPVFEFAVQGAAPGDDDAADHDGWVFEGAAIWPHKELPGSPRPHKELPGPSQKMLSDALMRAC